MHSRGQEEFLNAYQPVVGKTSAEIDMGPSGLWPKETRDRVAMSCLLLGVPLALAFEAVLIVPNYLEMLSPAWFTHAAVAAFIVLNLAGNIWKVLVTESSGRSLSLPHVLRPGWRYCFRCQLNAPPRSYHCPVCELCVLKRDHHCAFVGACIGYANHRYYLLGVGYALVGASYALWWHWSFVWETLGGLSLSTALACLVPHIFLVAGRLSLFQFVLAGAQMGFVVAWLLAAYLMGIQAFCLAKGQTQVEYRDGIRAYDQGPWANLVEVLGSRWWAALLCPFLPSPLLGDGLDFPARRCLPETSKDL